MTSDDRNIDEIEGVSLDGVVLVTESRSRIDPNREIEWGSDVGVVWTRRGEASSSIEIANALNALGMIPMGIDVIACISSPGSVRRDEAPILWSNGAILLYRDEEEEGALIPFDRIGTIGAKRMLETSSDGWLREHADSLERFGMPKTYLGEIDETIAGSIGRLAVSQEAHRAIRMLAALDADKGESHLPRSASGVIDVEELDHAVSFFSMGRIRLDSGNARALDRALVMDSHPLLMDMAVRRLRPDLHRLAKTIRDVMELWCSVVDRGMNESDRGDSWSRMSTRRAIEIMEDQSFGRYVEALATHGIPLDDVLLGTALDGALRDEEWNERRRATAVLKAMTRGAARRS